MRVWQNRSPPRVTLASSIFPSSTQLEMCSSAFSRSSCKKLIRSLGIGSPRHGANSVSVRSEK